MNIVLTFVRRLYALQLQRVVGVAVIVFLVTSMPVKAQAATATTLDGCEAVDILSPVATGIIANIRNVWEEFGPYIGIGLLCVAALLSLTDKGATWFRRALLVIALVFLLGGVLDWVDGLSDSGC